MLLTLVIHLYCTLLALTFSVSEDQSCWNSPRCKLLYVFEIVVQKCDVFGDACPSTAIDIFFSINFQKPDLESSRGIVLTFASVGENFKCILQKMSHWSIFPVVLTFFFIILWKLKTTALIFGKQFDSASSSTVCFRCIPS